LGTACIFFAHVTAFSTIAMWASLQQTGWFRQSPMYTFVTLPLALVFLSILGLVLRLIRYIVMHWDETVEDREIAWAKNTIEAENDVISLALSFLLVQVVRFAISGVLPNEEGKEEHGELFHHTKWQVLSLFGVGVLCATLSWSMLLIGRKYSLLEEEEEERSESGDVFHPTSTRALLDLRVDARRVHHVFGRSFRRGWEVSILFFSMCFAWCLFFSSRWMLGGSGMFTHLSCGLNITHAMFLTVACFVWIWLMDKVNDCYRHHHHAEVLSKGFEVMIRAMGILIGFAWEQSFDTAVGAIAEHVPHEKGRMKVLLSICCVGIVAPAWRLYLAPMVLEGWQFGFVAHHVVEKAKELTDVKHEPRAAEFIGPYRKMLHQLQCIHHSEEPHIDQTAAVFDAGLAQLTQNQDSTVQVADLAQP